MSTPVLCQGGAELIAEDVAADAADEEGAGAVEGGLRRLVAGLPAGREGHAMTDDALALAGEPVGRRDHVHMDAADDADARRRLSAHPSQRVTSCSSACSASASWRVCSSAS